MTDLIPSSKKNPLSRIKSKHHGELLNLEALWLANFTSKATKRTYGVAMREFCALLNVSDAAGFRAITPADIVAYRDALLENGKSHRSVRNRLSALSSCFGFLIERQVLSINPVEGVKRPKVDDSTGETPVLTAAQVALFLRQPDTGTLQGARDYAVLCLLFYTGARIGSPRSIRVKDFYEDAGFHVLRWQKKGGANQVVPVHPQLHGALLEYLSLSGHGTNPDAPLFMAVKAGRNRGQALVNNTFVNIWNRYRDQAGLPKQFTPHSSRATFATTADERGVPIQDIQQTLGHANISTTQAYIHARKHYKDSAIFTVRY